MKNTQKKLAIRPYVDTDQQAVIELWKSCGLVVPQNDPEKDIKTKLAFQPELFFVGLLGDRVAASVMAGYEGHRGWINYLAVAPELQRRGLGREMMDHAQSVLTAMGCPKINLQVRTTNTKVIEFYQRCGYSDDNVMGMGKRLK